jgi:hypothetical protein
MEKAELPANEIDARIDLISLYMERGDSADSTIGFLKDAKIKKISGCEAIVTFDLRGLRRRSDLGRRCAARCEQSDRRGLPEKKRSSLS